MSDFEILLLSGEFKAKSDMQQKLHLFGRCVTLECQLDALTKRIDSLEPQPEAEETPTVPELLHIFADLEFQELTAVPRLDESASEANLSIITKLNDARREALAPAMAHKGDDGADHKDWVIDRMVRALLGDKYDAFVRLHNDGEEGPETYDWDEGIAP